MDQQQQKEDDEPCNKYIELNENEQDQVEMNKEGEWEMDWEYLKSNKEWSDLKVHQQLIDQLQEKGFKKPSKIQATTIGLYKKRVEKGQPLTLVAQSQNGSGKTLCFMVSGVESVDTKIDYKQKGVVTPQVIVLAPTQALCGQIYNVGIDIVGNSGVMMGQLSGISDQCQINKQINEGHIMVGTPAAFINSLINKKTSNPINFTQLKMIAVDEADQIFIDETQGANLKKILNQKNNRFIAKDQMIRNLIFSATFPKQFYEKVELDKERGYAEMKLNPEQLTLKGVKQFVYRVNRETKNQSILEVFQKCDNQNQTIIFVNSKNYGMALMNYLSKEGISVAIFMGHPMGKTERTAIINRFRKNEISVLITTNVLARGIDMRRVLLVINADLPFIYNTHNADCETYLHRIGRTGRFGDFGIALNMIDTPQSEKQMQQITEYYQNDNITEIKHIQQLNQQIQAVYHQTQSKRKEFDETLL